MEILTNVQTDNSEMAKNSNTYLCLQVFISIFYVELQLICEINSHQISICIKTKAIYPWRDFHSDQVRIPFPSASKRSKSSFVGQLKGRSLQ